MEGYWLSTPQAAASSAATPRQLALSCIQLDTAAMSKLKREVMAEGDLAKINVIDASLRDMVETEKFLESLPEDVSKVILDEICAMAWSRNVRAVHTIGKGRGCAKSAPMTEEDALRLGRAQHDWTFAAIVQLRNRYTAEILLAATKNSPESCDTITKIRAELLDISRGVCQDRSAIYLIFLSQVLAQGVSSDDRQRVLRQYVNATRQLLRRAETGFVRLQLSV